MPHRVAIASFVDETMTFLAEPTTEAQFEPAVKRGHALIDANRGIPTYINGYLNVLETAGVEPRPIIEVTKAPGPFSSWITNQCFERYAGEIVAGLQKAGPLDGVLLALHGAMAVTGVPKPEAEICRRVKQAVGGLPVMVTLDLHSNEDRELTDATDGVFVLKTYPHIDSEEIGAIAADCMVRTIRGEIRPVQVMRRPGLASPSIFQGTADHPMRTIYERCRHWERTPGIICVSAGTGFAYSDVPDIGMYVVAVADGDTALAARAATDVSDLCWSLRQDFVRPLPKPPEAVANVMAMVARGDRPVVIADGADRIGDSTHMLAELIRQGASNWIVPDLMDPRAMQELAQGARLGDRVTVTLGGWYGPQSGHPVEVSGRLEYLGRPSYTLIGPMERGRRIAEGLVARINLGDNRHVVVSEKTRWAIDSAPIDAVGVDHRELDILVLKSRVHHRAYWDTVAKVNYPIDAPGYSEVVDLGQLEYENIPDDVYPIGRLWRNRTW
jgi:microcystin degradation protein MlrC